MPRERTRRPPRPGKAGACGDVRVVDGIIGVRLEYSGEHPIYLINDICYHVGDVLGHAGCVRRTSWWWARAGPEGKHLPDNHLPEVGDVARVPLRH